MPPESGKTQSVWMDEFRPDFPQLTVDAQTEVLVIGAGIAGLSCAYLLAKAGKQVIVVDGGRVVCGETQRTTAHLSDYVDDSYQEIVRIYGVDKAKLIKQSLTASIAQIEQIVEAEKIDCDFSRVDGFLWLSGSAKENYLAKEFVAGQQIEYEGLESIEAFKTIAGSPPALRYPDQAQFHAIKYLNGICLALEKLGVKIYQDSRVEKVDPAKGDKNPKATLKNEKTIEAQDIIVATNGPIIDFTIQTKQSAYRSFVVTLDIAKGAVPAGLYWDTEEPYHYVRLQPASDSTRELLIIGGEDHRVGEKNDAEQRFDRLEQWALEKFKLDKQDYTVKYRWSGQVYEPTDSLGFIGEDPELGKHIYVVTGDSGMGITNGTVAAILLTDLISGKTNPWTDIYSPARQTPKALANYIGENAHNLSHYKDNIMPGQLKQEEDITFGEGAIIERKGKRLAAYRDSNGIIETVSPYCTHLQGLVCWNSCESSWDCPVHGSRFAADGEVIYGPADGDLKPE